MSLSRAERLDRKYKCQLVCENCARRSQVTHGQWYYATRIWRDKGHSYVFLCNRPLCQKARAEGLLDSWEARGLKVMHQFDTSFQVEPEEVEA